MLCAESGWFQRGLKQAAQFVCRELKVPLNGEFVLL